MEVMSQDILKQEEFTEWTSSFHPEEWNTFIHQTFKEGQHYPQHATPRTVRVPAFLKLKVNAET